MATSPMDFTKVWRSIRIDDDGKIIDAAKLLEELRFQLKLQLEETRRDRNRSVQHFVASILIHVNSALVKARPAGLELPPRARESGSPTINYVRLKHYASKTDLSPDQLASLIITNSASRTLFDAQARAQPPLQATRSNPPPPAHKSSSTRRGSAAIVAPATPIRTPRKVHVSVSAQSKGSHSPTRRAPIKPGSSGLLSSSPRRSHPPPDEKGAEGVLSDRPRPAALESYVIETCGNCKRPGHTVRDCIGPVDESGWLAACPICNDNGHTYDDCRLRSELDDVAKEEADERFLLFYRQNKPSIKSRISWVNIYNQRHPLLISLPWTSEFAKKQQTLAADFKLDESTQQHPYILDLAWNTYTYEWIGNPDKEARFRMRDPGVDDFAIPKLRFRLQLP